MGAVRNYNYKMGFAINGVPIPDPSSFSGKDSALDASGERDATGLLHRDMVATKQPLKMAYTAMDWTTIGVLLRMMRGESFQFTFPDPYSGQLRTMKAYVGDRDWDVQLIMNPTEEYVGSLSFSVIEF